jgi:hypothetical protein
MPQRLETEQNSLAAVYEAYVQATQEAGPLTGAGAVVVDSVHT